MLPTSTMLRVCSRAPSASAALRGAPRRAREAALVAGAGVLPVAEITKPMIPPVISPRYQPGRPEAGRWRGRVSSAFDNRK